MLYTCDVAVTFVMFNTIIGCERKFCVDNMCIFFKDVAHV